MNFQVLLFYKYVTITNPLELKAFYTSLCEKYNLLGRTIIAEEGINATVEGLFEDTENFAKELLLDSRFCDMQIKRSKGYGITFPKLQVKVKQEIVGTRFPKEVDPRINTAPHLSPEELRSWYENEKDFVVVDMRNSYEYESGHFKNSIDPGMDASRELPTLIEKIKNRIRENTTPRHVPAKVIQVADIPRTKNGKVVELAVKSVVNGMPIGNTDALANPEALDLFRDLPSLVA